MRGPCLLLTAALTAALAIGLCTSVQAADPDEKCAAKKMRAIGKSINMRLGCIAAGTLSLDFDPDACLQRAEANFAKAFAKAELVGAGECPTEGDVHDREADIDDFVDSVAIDLFP